MAEEKAEAKPATQPAAATESKASTAALGELVNAASALQAVQAEAARQAMQLPEKRLDDASENGAAPGYTLRADGVKVDAFGNEVNEAKDK